MGDNDKDCCERVKELSVDDGSKGKSATGAKKGSSKPSTKKSAPHLESKKDQEYLAAVIEKRIKMFEELQTQQAALRERIGGEAIKCE